MYITRVLSLSEKSYDGDKENELLLLLYRGVIVQHSIKVAFLY